VFVFSAIAVAGYDSQLGFLGEVNGDSAEIILTVQVLILAFCAMDGFTRRNCFGDGIPKARRRRDAKSQAP
jgi:hypothetical protein